MVEEWRAAPEGFGAFYSVSNEGRVRDEKSGKIRVGTLAPTDSAYYRQISIKHPIHHRFKMMLVHRLVAGAFLGPCPPGHETHFLDCDRTNARADNLVYITKGENIRRAAAERRRMIAALEELGYRNPQARWRPPEMRRVLAQHGG